jgi:ParB family chromosome partitioning protein
MGIEVTFELVKVPAQEVEIITRVWHENERCQALLDHDAIADLVTTFYEHGQQVPAYGRKDGTNIEIADGSRRRFTAINTANDFYVWVGKLTDEQMSYLSQVGNQYKDTSAYEKGLRYLKLLDIPGTTQNEVAERIGLTRKAMMRCVYTARLPQVFIKCFESPNEVSARQGEQLFKQYAELNQEQKKLVIANSEKLYANKNRKLGTKKMIVMFEEWCGKGEKTEKSFPKKLNNGTSISRKNERATINIPKITDEKLKLIEDFIESII